MSRGDEREGEGFPPQRGSLLLEVLRTAGWISHVRMCALKRGPCLLSELQSHPPGKTALSPKLQRSGSFLWKPWPLLSHRKLWPTGESTRPVCSGTAVFRVNSAGAAHLSPHTLAPAACLQIQC